MSTRGNRLAKKTPGTMVISWSNRAWFNRCGRLSTAITGSKGHVMLIPVSNPLAVMAVTCSCPSSPIKESCNGVGPWSALVP